jgi:hypothetical protein
LPQFGLIRFKISSALRKLQYIPAGRRWHRGDHGFIGGHHGSKPEKGDRLDKMDKIDHKMHKMHDKMHGPFSMEKKEKMISEFKEKIEQEYLKDFDLSVPLQWVIHTVARLIMAKMQLVWVECVMVVLKIANASFRCCIIRTSGRMEVQACHKKNGTSFSIQYVDF